VKPAPFHYIRPTTVAEAIAALSEAGGDGKVLAGGQSLVAAMNFRLARPAVLIDINGIAALDHLSATADTLRIGALTRHARFHAPVVDAPLGRLLAFVVRHIAHYPIRQRGTFAGSLSHADPASEWCLTAQTLGAEMVIAGPAGERVVAAAEFFKGTFRTAIGEDEILTEIRLPMLGEGWRGGFYEFARRAGDFALAMALVAVRIEGGTIADVRLGIGSVADRPLRLVALERAMVGRRPDAALFAEIAEAAVGEAEPSDDIHASAELRLDLVRTSVKRALERAVA